MRAYRATPEGKKATKVSQQKVHATPRGKAVRQEGKRRWKKSERGKKSSREWARKNYRWDKHISKTYGVSVEQFELMSAGGCNICGTKEVKNWKRTKLYIDHDHVTGTVRGVLCDHCNRGLGCFHDDIEKLAKAISYLTRK